MLDDLMGLLGDSMNIVNAFDKLEQKTAPILAEIQQNADKVNPEFMRLYDENLKKVGAMRQDLEAAKEQLRESQEKN